MLDMEFKPIFRKTETGENYLELSSVYPNNCSEQKIEVITDEVLEFYESLYRAWDSERVKNNRHKNKKIYLGNEDFEGSIGLFICSHDEKVESEVYLDHIKKFFGNRVYERGMMYYMYKYTEQEISEIENVSQMAVSKSIRLFKKSIAKIYNIELEDDD